MYILLHRVSSSLEDGPLLEIAVVLLEELCALLPICAATLPGTLTKSQLIFKLSLTHTYRSHSVMEIDQALPSALPHSTWCCVGFWTSVHVNACSYLLGIPRIVWLHVS
jgi:hypothetical protein